MSAASIPTTLADIETPALVVDLDIMERNLRRVASYADEHGLRLRPHTKTHKTPELARRQIALGAVGITVAKVGEAEVMRAADPADLLVAYPVIGASKLDRLMQVARSGIRIAVALDSLEAAQPLSDAATRAGVEIGVLAEADVGLGRMGVSSTDALVALGQGIDRLPGLHLDGIAFYPGHIKALDAAAEDALRDLAATLDGLVASFDRTGLNREIVSGGSTPTLFRSHTIPAMNEIRPGTYIFNDRNSVACGACSWNDCAASILATVVSTARPGGMMIDGGSKTFFSDRLVTGDDGLFGRIIEAPEARFFRMNEEHGFVDRSGAPFRVGDRIRVIPNHICVAVNLHERIYGVRNERVTDVWRVAARGKLQ